MQQHTKVITFFAQSVKSALFVKYIQYERHRVFWGAISKLKYWLFGLMSAIKSTSKDSLNIERNGLR